MAIPGGGGSEVITFAVKAKALSWSATRQDQDAAFSITCNPTLGTNQTVESYLWLDTVVYEMISPGENLLKYDAPKTAKTVVGHANSAGFWDAWCRVVIKTVDPDTGQITRRTNHYRGWAVAVGGPLTFGIVNTYAPELTPPVHDDYDVAKPWYLQYFGWSHANPPTSNTYQKTQDGEVAIRDGQPAGTTMTWTVTSPLRKTVLTQDANGNVTKLKIEADGAGIGLVVKVRFYYRLPDPPYTVVDADDTTAQTADLPEGKTRPNAFSGHLPTDTSSASRTIANPAFDPGGTSCGLREYIKVTDQAGKEMPGLYVQERYAPLPALPANFKVNTNDDFWLTKAGGIFHEDDYMSYKWPPPPPWATVGPFTHTYWAASKESARLSVEGCNVGTWKMTFYPGDSDNSPNPGTVTHVKDPNP